MAKIVRNESGSTQTWVGQEILDSASYTIQSTEQGMWANDDDVLASIVNGDLVVNDGTSDFTSPTLAINWLKDLEEVDSSGRKVIKTTAAQKGATYLANMCEITTALSVESNKYDGTIGDYAVKFFDGSGVELTSDLSTCVETRVIFQPSNDYEIISGKVHLIDSASVDVRMWVLGGLFHPTTYAPIASNMELIRNINFKYVQSNLISDGRASKFMAFETVGAPYPTNKLLFKITHPAGHQYSFLVSVEMFR